MKTTDSFDRSKIDIVDNSSSVNDPLGAMGLGPTLIGSVAAFRYNNPPKRKEIKSIRNVVKDNLTLYIKVLTITCLLKIGTGFYLFFSVSKSESIRSWFSSDPI